MPDRMTYKESAIKRIRSKISRSGIDALLISNQHNIRYLTGLYFAGVILIISERGRPLYFVDRMNRALAERLLEGTKLRVVTVSETVTGALAEHVAKAGIKKLGFNSGDLPVSVYGRLSRLIRGVKMVPHVNKTPVPCILEEIRKIKTPEEIRILRRAARETVRIWREVKRNIKPGMRERDIAALTDMCARGRGYEISFSTIAAVGENTAYPHAVPTAKRLKKGEHLLLDFGIRIKGYCSDLTRTWYKGRINRQIRDFHESVQRAHDLAIKMIKPGTVISSVVERVNRAFAKDGVGTFMLHGLGHGVGVEVHERPFLRKGCREQLREGMVITIEPGLYRPGVGGIRKEDMVLVTAKGCEVLTG